MAAALPAASAVGGVVKGAGDLIKGQMTANSLRAQAGLQETQAQEALQAGQYDVFKQQLQATNILGRSTAAYGASGVGSGSASEQAVLMAGAANAELDRQNILHGADIKATTYENQASLNKFGANSALEGSYFAALGDVLGGSSTLASSFVNPKSGKTNPGSSKQVNLTPNSTSENAFSSQEVANVS